MKAVALCYTLLMIPMLMYAQGKNDYVWLMGYGFNDSINHFGGTKIDFNGDTAAFSFFNLPFHFGFDVPCSISDENGNLQFYTNGCRIINSQNELIENGDDLSPGWYQSIECDNYPYGYDGYQNYMILPWPGRLGHYIYFHYSIEPDFYTSTTFYSEIDMIANNGSGKVIKKNEILWALDTIGGSISAVRHGNGRDWWVVIPEHFDNIFHFYLVTPDTIEGPFIQDWNNQDATNVLSGWNSVFSSDGRKFVRLVNSAPSSIFVYNFDRCSGLLSNPIRIDIFDTTTTSNAPWVAVSPNSRYLYLQFGQKKLYQYDLDSPNIEDSVILIDEYDDFIGDNGLKTRFHAMALAPNNKIYMSSPNGAHYLHVINNPDFAGEDCNFRQHDIELPTNISAFLPNFPNFQLYDLPGSICDTLGINGVYQYTVVSKLEVRMKPNPASEFVQIQFEKSLGRSRIRVFNLLGQLINEEDTAGGYSIVNISVSGWPSGTYVVQVEQPAIGCWLGKLVVTPPRE